MVKTRCCYPQYSSMYVNDHRLVGLVLMYVFYGVSLSLKNGKAMLMKVELASLKDSSIK